MDTSSKVSTKFCKFECERPKNDVLTDPCSPEPNYRFDFKSNKKYSIAFDLDNTLIYTTPIKTENTSFVIYQRKSINYKTRSDSSIIKTMSSKPSLKTKIGSIENSKKIPSQKVVKRKFYVQIRPKLLEFLRSVSQDYNIFFYTASEKEYAKEVVSKIFQNAFYLDNVKNDDFDFLDKIIFSRENCTFMNGYELKDLRLLNKPLSDVILVDDIQGSGLLQPMNSLIIPPFYGDTNDNFLFDELLPLLSKCSQKSELIPSVRKYAIELSPHLVLFQEFHENESC